MLKEKLKSIVDALIEVSYLAIIFLTPIYFSLFFKGNNIFELNKEVLFRILVLFLLLFTFIKALIYKKFDWRFFTSKYFIIPFLFLSVFFLATLFSINPSLSYYGLYDRQEGLVSLIYYFLFFILLFINIGNGESEIIFKKIERIVLTAVLSSFIVSVYGLAQMAGFDFFDWTESPFSIGRAMSTFGQPNFLASYLLLVIPLSLYLLVQVKKFLIKFFIGLIFTFQFICLLLTYSRAGWLGFLGGIFITAIIYFWLKKLNKEQLKIGFKKYKTAIFIFFAFILIFISALLLFNRGMFVERVKSSFNVKSGSSGARIEFWKAGIDAIKKRPLLGYGPEMQGEALIKYYKKDWASFGRVNDYPNRAHNILLDTALTSGIFGLFFYILLIYFFIKLTIKNIKYNQRYFYLSLALLLSVSGYLISLFFGFAVVGTHIYFWLFLAIMAFINSELKRGGDFKKERNHKIPHWLAYVFILLASATIFYQINKEFKQLIADYYFKQLKEAYAAQEYYKAMEIYSYIKEEKIYDYYYDYSFSIMLADLLNESNILVYKKTSGNILRKVLKRIEGDNYSALYLRAKVNTALADDKNKELYNLAEENFKKLIELSPEMPQSYREMAAMYTKKEDYQKALDGYNKALLLLPDLNNPVITSQHRFFIKFEKYLIYKRMADIYLKENLYIEAEKYYWLAYDNNMSDISLYKEMADTYYLRGDMDKAIWYNKRGYMLNPNDYTWPFSIALLYKEKGNFVRAEEYAEQALSLKPENQEINNFIINLK